MILPPAVVVHGHPHLLAALAPGLSVLLLSAPGAGCYAGAGWWQALTSAQPQPAALDCADQPGRALEALEAGCRIVILHSCPAWHDVASRFGPGLLLRHRPPALDLQQQGATRHLAAWLQRDGFNTGASPPPTA